MTAGRRLAPGLALVLALAACGDDGAAPSSDLPPTDTGVTFPDTVTVPGSDATGAPSTSTTVAEVTVTAGAPAGFPADFPRPEQARVIGGSATTVAGDRVLAVDLTSADPVAEVLATLREAVSDAEFVLLDDGDDGLRFETDSYVGDILVTTSPAGTVVVLTATMPTG